MHRVPMRCTLVVCLAATLAQAASADTTGLPEFTDSIQVVDDLPLSFPVEAGRRVTVRFGIGELDIVAADVDEIRAELEVGCRELSEDRCRSYRDRLRLEATRTEQGTEVALRGLSRWRLRKLDLDGTITVPRDSPIMAEIGVGDVEIRSGTEDVQVRMGIGDLTVRVPEASVRSVAIATRIGDASLSGGERTGGTRRKLLGARLDWSEGSGDARVEVGLRIGDAKVVLD